METTRQTILSILRRRRRATVYQLTKELGLAPATVRRHLDILARDGHVDVSQVRRKTGRPHYVFSLSEAGEDLFPKHYVRITNRLIEEIVALEPAETAERSGAELANLVFEKMAHRLAQRIAPHVHGSTLTERVRATMSALNEEGIDFDVEAALVPEPPISIGRSARTISGCSRRCWQPMLPMWSPNRLARTATAPIACGSAPPATPISSQASGTCHRSSPWYTKQRL